MTNLTRLFAVSVVLVLSACAAPHEYPLSQQQCTAADPVHDLKPLDCVKAS